MKLKDTTATSPAAMLGRLLAPLPLAPLGPVARLALRLMEWRHPDAVGRLAGLDGQSIALDAEELPFVLILEFRGGRREIRVVRTVETEAEAVTATIRAPLATLMDLAEGRLDGDALFFSRDLVIEGETEAVVALRNALDGEEINLVRDLLSPLGPLAGPLNRTLDWLAGRRP